MSTQDIDTKLNIKADAELEERVKAALAPVWSIVEEFRRERPGAGHYKKGNDQVYIGQAWRDLNAGMIAAFQEVNRDIYKARFIERVEQIQEVFAEQ